jgi:hypothetical protein
MGPLQQIVAVACPHWLKIKNFKKTMFSKNSKNVAKNSQNFVLFS